MYSRQPREIPARIYEPNIIHNPLEWMGIWTPHGWRVHRKRFGAAERFTKTLVGNGRQTFFPEVLIDPSSNQVGWQDDLHLRDDSFTDAGIYPADPRVEYPPGRPRWAISHTLLNYPVADHNLYTHEYVWDMTHGHLQTHFHEHVVSEEARTDGKDGLTVQVRHRPISVSIEGNVRYPLPNSAVRGVWATPDKSGTNLYTREVVQLIAMHNALYAPVRRTPVVQCYGMWHVLDTDPLREAFDADTGMCRDRDMLIERFKIPLDEPKISMVAPAYRDVPSQTYEGLISMLAESFVTINQSHLDELRRRIGQRFAIGKVGYAAATQIGLDRTHYEGYGAQFDLNANGVIDDEDESRFAAHLGREVRYNSYLYAYFGGDWLTTGVSQHCEHPPGIPIIASYAHGSGYDSSAGTIFLHSTPGRDKPVWVEYHYEAPAAAGEQIVVYAYRETAA